MVVKQFFGWRNVMAWSRDAALLMGQRHVLEAEIRCIRQRDLIERIRGRGYDSVEAESLLASMLDFLNVVRAEVRRLELLS